LEKKKRAPHDTHTHTHTHTHKFFCTFARPDPHQFKTPLNLSKDISYWGVPPNFDLLFSRNINEKKYLNETSLNK
jgi:hypothetical protein